MAIVKGSKQYRVEVVRRHPWHRWLIAAFGLLLLIAAASGGYWLGQVGSYVGPVSGQGQGDKLRVQLQAANTEVLDLRQQVANLELGSEVDRRASESVRQEVIDLKSEVAALEQDISFYRSLMSPSENSSGLTIGSLNLIATSQAGEYDYKLVVQQLATRHSLLNGSLNFNVVGRQADKLVTLALKDIAENVEVEDIKLRFKYFQTIEGRLKLPEGFEPERIELVASSKGSNPVVVKKNFGWLVEER